MSSETWDLEDVLSIARIRQHTKTTNVIQTPDDLLVLFRQARIEAAEAFTGMLLRPLQPYEQSITSRESTSSFRRRTKIRLDHPVADGLLTINGKFAGQGSRIIQVPRGATRVIVPVMHEAVDTASCCDPCSVGAENHGATATYNTGLTCATEIPAGIIVGCLKYIAWTLMNAGDELKTVRDGTSSQINGISGTNDAVFASGAFDEWRRFRDHK